MTVIFHISVSGGLIRVIRLEIVERLVVGSGWLKIGGPVSTAKVLLANSFFRLLVIGIVLW